MKPTLKYLFRFFITVVLVVLIANWNLIAYGCSQLKGQLSIMSNTILIREALKSKNLNAEQKRKLLLISEIKKFAVDSLGLNASDNYTTFYDQKNKPVLYILTACEPFELKSFQWKFPLIGYVSYKGFFKRELANPDYNDLKKKGFDVDVSPVSAWSTLGFFNDPVLSNFLKRGDGQIAELIIHELTHVTIYNKSNVDYNENLATFVGEQGAAQFLKFKYGSYSKQLMDYLNYKADEELYGQHLINGAKKLDSLYKSFTPKQNKILKTKLKIVAIKDIMQSLDTLNFYNEKVYRFDFDKMTLPNNTDFMINSTYRNLQNDFNKELNSYNSDLKQFITIQKGKK